MYIPVNAESPGVAPPRLSMTIPATAEPKGSPAMTLPVPSRVPVHVRSGVAHILAAAAERVTPALAPGSLSPCHGEPVLADPWRPGVYCPADGRHYRMRPASYCPDHPGAELAAPGGSGRGICPADGRSYAMEAPEVMAR